MVAAALALNLGLATRRGGFTEERVFAGLALTSASFILIAKTVWPYDFMEAFVFATVWAVGRWRGAGRLAGVLLPPMALCGFGLFAEIGSTAGQPARVVALVSGAMFVMLGTWILSIAHTAGRSAPAA